MLCVNIGSLEKHTYFVTYWNHVQRVAYSWNLWFCSGEMLWKDWVLNEVYSNLSIALIYLNLSYHLTWKHCIFIGDISLNNPLLMCNKQVQRTQRHSHRGGNQSTEWKSQVLTLSHFRAIDPPTSCFQSCIQLLIIIWITHLLISKFQKTKILSFCFSHSVLIFTF